MATKLNETIRKLSNENYKNQLIQFGVKMGVYNNFQWDPVDEFNPNRFAICEPPREPAEK